MKILVLNCGSSSVKYQLLDMTDESVLAKGIIERIGMDDAILTHRPTGKDQFRTVQPIFEHGTAIQVVTEALTDPEHGVIHDIKAIEAVGHRVAHGGEKFTTSMLITKEVKEVIAAYFDLAPLHNPPNLKGITATEKVLPNVPQEFPLLRCQLNCAPLLLLFSLPFAFQRNRSDSPVLRACPPGTPSFRRNRTGKALRAAQKPMAA